MTELKKQPSVDSNYSSSGYASSDDNKKVAPPKQTEHKVEAQKPEPAVESDYSSSGY